MSNTTSRASFCGTTLRGVTLIELMITLTVAAILLLIGVPSFRDLIQNNKLITQTNQLVSSLNYARSEAVKRRMPVGVCVLNNAADGCDTSSTAWNTNGWMAFADVDGDDAYAVANDTLLKIWTDAVAQSDITITGSASTLIYQPSGFLAAGAAVGMAVSLTDSTLADRCVSVVNAGRVQTDEITGGVTCP